MIDNVTQAAIENSADNTAWLFWIIAILFIIFIIYCVYQMIVAD